MPIQSVSARAYTVPTDAPEADGTFAWTDTTLLVAEASGGGMSGLGYSYTAAAAAALVNGMLAHAVHGLDAMDPQAAWRAMDRAARNIGRSGLAATAISAVDAALWDLKARLLDLPLATLLGRCRTEVEIYGSGGFTCYDDAQLARQLAGWVEQDGCRAVKMKVGTEPDQDPTRVRAAKQAIGRAHLFVDANGACERKQAIHLAGVFAAEADVRWFEEPVSSNDLPGLRFVRDHAPPAMEVAAGEYAYTLDDVRNTLAAGALDVQQLDATRCGGVTGFMRAAALCEAFHTPVSAHCGPALHLHLACAAPRFRHIEWFHDHARIEHMLFDGAPVPSGGTIRPNLSRPGLGLEFKRADAERFAVKGD